MRIKKRLSSNEIKFPRLNVALFMRQLSKRKGKAKIRFARKKINALLEAVYFYQFNHYVPDPKIDPGYEYGRCVTWHVKESRVRKANVLRCLADAIVHLPEGQEVELREKSPDDFGRSKAVAWYVPPRSPSSAAPQKLPLVMNIPWEGEYDAAGGYYDHGVIRLP